MNSDRDQLLLEKISRQRAEEALEDAQERFRSIFDSSHDGFAYTTFEGHFLEVNAAFEQLTGYSREELLTRMHRDMTPPGDAAKEESRSRQWIESMHAV